MNETIIFPNLHITLENVGKTFTVFGIDIAYYGLIIAIGMLLGVALILHEAKRCGKNEDDYLIRLGGKNYGKNEFEAYQAEQDNDRGSRVENIFA